MKPADCGRLISVTWHMTSQPMRYRRNSLTHFRLRKLQTPKGQTADNPRMVNFPNSLQ